ncbi:hypothetical protein ACYZT3_02315 [Pseudomonas sp. MDT1-16]
MQKAMLPESHRLFLGTYVGAGSAPSVREAIENSDCVISIGARFTDTSTGLFSVSLCRPCSARWWPNRNAGRCCSSATVRSR